MQFFSESKFKSLIMNKNFMDFKKDFVTMAVFLTDKFFLNWLAKAEKTIKTDKTIVWNQ